MLQIIRLCLVLAVVGPAVVFADTAPGAGRVARGKYLVTGVGRCFWCHSPLDNGDPAVPIPARLGSGDVLDEKAPINAPNLTPDRATGLGGWTDQQVARAIREGIGRDGKQVLSSHPASYYSVMTDEDVLSIVAYLRTLRPIRRALARSAPPGREHESVQPFVSPMRAGTARSATERGKYLVQLGECEGCHTPARADGSPVRELAFAGGRRFSIEKGVGSEVSSFDPTYPSASAVAASTATGRIVASANLTQDPSGIPYYTEATFIQTIRTGKVGGVRALSAAMPWIFFRTMTDADLRDIFAYLRSVRPARHRVNNTDPPTWCAVCGRRHGLGEMNAASPPK
jgi:mono/diheme cytochrome c family protein